MYAINHAATALLIKKKFPKQKMVFLLIAVQAVEILWVLFNYLGIEHFSVIKGTIHLDYLPWSHSIFTGIILSLAAWLILSKGFKQNVLAIAISAGIISHIILDLLMHEPDIALVPFISDISFGLNIQSIPLLTIIIETAYGVFCWWHFKGTKSLLATIIILNLINIPFIFNLSPQAIETIQKANYLLPTIILIQILYTWYFVWKFSKDKKLETANS